nr:unnamed protein product [Callosobruchus chinensis]
MTNEAETGESLLQVPDERYGGEEDGEIEEEDVAEADSRCGEAVETAKHVIFDCPALCRRRSSYLEVVQEEGRR